MASMDNLHCALLTLILNKDKIKKQILYGAKIEGVDELRARTLTREGLREEICRELECARQDKNVGLPLSHPVKASGWVYNNIN